MRLTGSPDSVATRPVAGASGRLSDRRETPLWGGLAVLVAQPAGADAGRTFCEPRPSCGDTNGDTCTLVLYFFECQYLAEIG